jgi:hypothetical protein
VINSSGCSAEDVRTCKRDTSLKDFFKSYLLLQMSIVVIRSMDRASGYCSVREVHGAWADVRDHMLYCTERRSFGKCNF